MKILLVAPFTQPHYSWLKTLRQLHCQVKIFKLTRFPANQLINWLRLTSIISRYQPDHIFFSGGLDAVLPVKNTIFFAGVAVATLSANERQIGVLSKLVVVNEPSHVQTWLNLGAHQAVCLPISAVDPDNYSKTKIKKIYPVSFIGTLLLPRQKFLQSLAEQGIPINIWGWLPPGVSLLPALKPYYHGEAWGKSVARIYCQSQIGLNLVPDHLPAGGNLRTFEIAAAGALLLTNRLSNLWFPASEAVIFNNLQDCIDKIKFYLSHPDQLTAFAASAKTRTLKKHTYRQRFKQLLKLIP